MATINTTNTKEFNKAQLDDMLAQLQNARSRYDTEADQCSSAAGILAWLGLLAQPTGIVGKVLAVTSDVLFTAWGYKISTIQSTITKSIDQLENIKDILQDNPNYNLVRMQVKQRTESYEDTYYMYPVDFDVISLHSTNPPGWLYL